MDDDEKGWLALLSLIGEVAKELKGIKGILKFYLDATKPKLTNAETKSLRKLEEKWEDDPNTMLIPPNSEQTEETIFMDLKEVTVIAETELAFLVTKKGYANYATKDDYPRGGYPIITGQDDVVIKLKPGAFIQGRLVYDGTTYKKKGVMIFARGEDNRWWGTTDENGQFEIIGLKEGAFQLKDIVIPKDVN